MSKPPPPFICSLCQQPTDGFGNNADPFRGICCDACDTLFVIPARLLLMQTPPGKLGDVLDRLERAQLKLMKAEGRA